jgi:hypothetical protein
VLRRANSTPMTAREIAEALIAGKAPQATRKQAIDLQAAILVALRKRNGGAVVGEGAPARWRLKEAAQSRRRPRRRAGDRPPHRIECNFALNIKPSPATIAMSFFLVVASAMESRHRLPRWRLFAVSRRSCRLWCAYEAAQSSDQAYPGSMPPSFQRRPSAARAAP